MKYILSIILFSNLLFGFGSNHKNGVFNYKNMKKNGAKNEASTTKSKSKKLNLTNEEKKYLIINKLRESSPLAKNIIFTGETIDLNIPVFNATIIKLPQPVAEMIFNAGTGIEIIEDPTVTKSDIFKIRSVSPILNNNEIQLRLIDNTWLRLKIDSNLKSKRYSKINIQKQINPEIAKDILRKKYFNRKYRIKNITSSENTKSINLIIDRLDKESSKYSEQIAIEEKINRFIIKNNDFGIFLSSIIVEPFEIVSSYKPNLNTLKAEKEIILLNMVVFNYNNKYLQLTPKLVKTIFPNYISFYYDIEKSKVGPSSKERLLVVIEESYPIKD